MGAHCAGAPVVATDAESVAAVGGDHVAGVPGVVEDVSDAGLEPAAVA